MRKQRKSSLLMYLSCLSVHPLHKLFHLSTLSITIHDSIYPSSVHPCIYLSSGHDCIYPSIHPCIYLSSIHDYICLSIYIPVHTLHPSIHFRLVCIYQVCEHTVSQINPEEDLQWYSLHYGADMPYAWPEFEVSYENLFMTTMRLITNTLKIIIIILLLLIPPKSV